MTKEEILERRISEANIASAANDYVISMLQEREARAIQEACNWYRSGAEGEGRALCYVATLNEVRAMREEHETRLRLGREARQKLYGATAVEID